MTFEDHINKIKRYIPANTVESRYQAELARIYALEIKNKLKDLIQKVKADEYKDKIINDIDEGINAVDTLINHLSKHCQKETKIRSLIDEIEIKWDHANYRINNQHSSKQ